MIFYRKESEGKELEKSIQSYRETLDRAKIQLKKLCQVVGYLEDRVADLERDYFLMKRELNEDSDHKDDHEYTIPGHSKLFFERNGITLERM